MPVTNGWRETDDSLRVTRTGRTQVLELGREEDESEAGGEWTMVRGGRNRKIGGIGSRSAGRADGTYLSTRRPSAAVCSPAAFPSRGEGTYFLYYINRHDALLYVHRNNNQQ